MMERLSKCVGIVTINFVGHDRENAVIEFNKVADCAKAHQMLNVCGFGPGLVQ